MTLTTKGFTTKGFTEISRDERGWIEANKPIFVTVKRGVFYYQNPQDSNDVFIGISRGRVYKSPFRTLDEIHKYG